ncbi:hypothetical protein VSX64_10020 [Aurantimonas sp. C2-6-R+9]|nr:MULTISPECIES: hypothetical protein [unclassified Aurantimonas]MEC5289989.1 hypothetical protein [Aurantimonas sp. C2-3-R2]MEC5322635.1 hypothetical protein [Aurantimonas sp. A3-2-R12]MEC5381211.1 hypothetical protein [Aurantimonas sp. C2-6-R+9]MEC5411054.1 hypothetical protein [Aurantimonas sp. C2-4-R8]
MSKASPALEAFIDETIRRGREKGYVPTIFIGMRQQLGTRPAIAKLVQSGDLQSGFKRLHKLNLLDWTIEAAVEKFPNEFTADDLGCASFRLREARKGDGNADRT